MPKRRPNRRSPRLAGPSGQVPVVTAGRGRRGSTSRCQGRLSARHRGAPVDMSVGYVMAPHPTVESPTNNVANFRDDGTPGSSVERDRAFSHVGPEGGSFNDSNSRTPPHVLEVLARPVRMATNFVDASDFTGRALLVQGISRVHSQCQNADKITIHFQKNKNKGGDVTKVLYPLDSNRDAAIVVFDDAKDRETTLLHQHLFYDVSLQVQRLPPLFRSLEVEIDPFYATLLPDVVHSLMSSYGPKTNPSLGRQNIHKLSFSCTNELRYVEEEVYKNVARQNEAPHFSSAATGYSHPEQVELTEQEGMNYEDEVVFGEKRNGYQPKDGDPEVFIGQLTAERDSSATHAAGDKKLEEKETSTTDVQVKGPLEQTSDYDDNGSSTQKDYTVITDMFSFSFLMKFEKAAFEKILKNRKVKFIQKKIDFSVEVTFLPCTSKQSTKEIQQAVDEFITLYQTTHDRLSRKTVDCPPSVSVDNLEKAASKTSECFPNDVFITILPGNPIRCVFLSSVDVEEVVQYFRKLADIKSLKKLKTPSVVPKDTKSASTHSAVSQFGNTNRSNQVNKRESQFHSTSSYNTSLNVTRGPNDTQSLGAIGDVCFVTNEGITIYIRKGDITMQRVEAIVSPCQQNLDKTGGAAKAIGDAAGFQLESWCRDYMKRCNIQQVNVMECLISPGFNLCHTIIHAVGPRSPNNMQTFMKELYHTFLNCLLKAECHKIASLAMPLIGSGMIAGPKKDCADALVQAIFHFSGQENKTKYLRDIVLVNIDSKASEAIKLSFDAMFQTPITATTETGDDVRDAEHRMGQESDRLSDKDIQNDSKQMAATLNKDDCNQIKSDRASGTKTSSTSPKTSSTDDKTADESCPICLKDFNKDMHVPVQILSCKHSFCKVCITKHLQKHYMCPVCRAVCGQPKGNQPKGTMKVHTGRSYELSGFKGVGVITITYDIPSGIQSEDHPNPGNRFTGVTRTAYLPDNQEGRKVLSLLRKAFDAGLVFTVGSSVTTGTQNTVTWTGIHHKTATTGGPPKYGYPDPDYLKRVKEDLAAIGIK